MPPIVEKFLWSLAPLVWGIFVWSMGWGYGSAISYGPNLFVRTAIALGIIFWFYRSTFNMAQKNYTVTFFDYSVTLPSWQLFMLLPIIAASCALLFHPLWQYSILHSIIVTVLLSSCIEEFVTHSIFVRYSMSIQEFLLFNTVSAVSFAFMHAGYSYELPSITELLSNGYFQFAFSMGLLIYKTKRIEIPIIYHIFSNFFNTTLPHYILLKPLPIIVSLIIHSLLPLGLAGLSHKQDAT